MAKTIYRLSNWSHYNRALIQRGSLTIWFSEEAIDQWTYGGAPQQGAQYTYSDRAIETCLSLRLVFHLPLRQTQGFVGSLVDLMRLRLPVPDYSTLSRRHKGLSVNLFARKKKSEEQKSDEKKAQEAPRHIVIDSTGLKVYGEGEWKQRQHGKAKRRTWRKIHLAIDEKTGEITATTLTDNSKHDCSQVAQLLEETVSHVGDIAKVGGDGSYDKWRAYAAIAAHGALPVIPPQHNAKIKQHGNTKAAPLARDEAIRYIRRHGRKQWKCVHGYHRRSLAETAMMRFKRIIGCVLRARDLVHQQVEARLGSMILNQMLDLGRPQSYAVVIA